MSKLKKLIEKSELLTAEANGLGDFLIHSSTTAPSMTITTSEGNKVVFEEKDAKTYNAVINVLKAEYTRIAKEAAAANEKVEALEVLMD